MVFAGYLTPEIFALARGEGVRKPCGRFVETGKLQSQSNPDFLTDRQIAKTPAEVIATLLKVKLALLGSSTLDLFLPGLWVAALRHGFWLDIHIGNYGQYFGDMHDPASAPHASAPEVIQQAVLPTVPGYLGGVEHRLAGSTAELICELNRRLRLASDVHLVAILALDRQSAYDELNAWYGPALWLRAKQEVSPLLINGYSHAATLH